MDDRNELIRKMKKVVDERNRGLVEQVKRQIER